MKKALLMNLALLLLAASPLFAQKKVFVSDNVLQIAAQAQFDYKGTVKKASNKDGKALIDLFEFIRLLEADQADEHAITCLELIPLASDEVFAKAVKTRSIKMKAALLRRITAAQERTQKEALKKPMEEWAPYSWKALNNFEFNIEAENKTTAQKPAPAAETAAGQINSATDAAKPKEGAILMPPTDAGQAAPGKRKD